MSVLHALLSEYRERSQSEAEKGGYFERLARIFLKYDRLYSSQFTEVWHFSDWARKHGFAEQDLGIDLVAKNADDGKFTAIQCKFYSDDNPITKGDIDSFVAYASNRRDEFNRLILIDTSRKGLNRNAKDLLDRYSRYGRYNRISIDDLEASSIRWETFRSGGQVELEEKKQLREHQQEALTAVRDGLERADRGKLIMACGTGKTFTSLKIAEDIAGNGKLVLYLVPSLALMAQTIREWANDCGLELNSYATCSDVMVGRRRSADLDSLDVDVHDLALDATTDAESLANKFVLADDRMSVIYTTYHSIDVISRAQKEFGLPDIDLIICDEAHRTTGVQIEDKEESHFTKIHDDDYVKGRKRLYMTATPKIYSAVAREQAREQESVLLSMDDEDIFGGILYFISFGGAVSRDLLCDYKVIILAVDEEIVSRAMQYRLKDEENILNLDDVSKVIGCYNALNKKHTGQEELQYDKEPIRRAVAFSNKIASSQVLCDKFNEIIDDYHAAVVLDEVTELRCELDHVDGGHNANERNRKLSWLASPPDEDTCHILSNAKCLSEGVDVPSLDAIIFMQPRKSQVDVVQAVGRVMRKAEGKQLGYVILPVAISPDIAPEKALENHEKYKSLWQVLNALRSHDENLDARINQAGLGEDISDKIQVYVVSDKLPEPAEGEKSDSEGKTPQEKEKEKKDIEEQYRLWLNDVHKAIKDKMVKKCGTRTYWPDWANDIRDIAENYILHIRTILGKRDSPARKAFNNFLQDVHDDLNDEVSEDDAIEMIAQHLITKPIFDALFEGSGFADKNPVSKSMDGILTELQKYNLEVESKKLKDFYKEVDKRVKGVKSPKARQALMIELYNRFFKKAFPSSSEKLGIAYTPIEVVDFIIHSVNNILKSEFNEKAGLGSEGVHIFDPFTGTGSFIVRLIESGLLEPEELIQKYECRERPNSEGKLPEIHANEIVLLAYYIACINIENAYHAETGESYKPFEGICLTDTFALYDDKPLEPRKLPDNSHRRIAQKSLKDIRVIIGNPPYAVFNEGDVKYSKLDDEIKNSYMKEADATNRNSLYDSYIRSIKWASNSIGDSGIIGYVSNASWIEGESRRGMRKCLQEEFSSIYIFNLRGNQRTKGEVSKKEGGKIFGSGSRSPIAISILVKNPEAKETGKIYIHDIGDYLKREDKIKIIKNYKSISGISNENKWQEIFPDQFNDWINQRDDSFNNFIAIGDKTINALALFSNYSRGLATAKDAWCYNSCKEKLKINMHSMINFYNSEVERYKNGGKGSKAKDFIDKNPKKISWSRALIQDLERQKNFKFQEKFIVESIYRPFFKTWLYFDAKFNEMIYQIPKLFPEKGFTNKVICISGVGAASDFCTLMIDKLPDLGFIESSQCFPLTLYDKLEISEDSKKQGNLDVTGANNYNVRHGISDAGLQHFQNFYSDDMISEDDIFYYVYGLLHSQEYRERFKNNLSKQLPRIPCVKEIKDFIAFVGAGRKLADLHLNYETQKAYRVEFNCDIDALDNDKFEVIKMKHPKGDKSCIIYNHFIKLSGIPEEAYEYIISGKSAIKWVMEMQRNNINDTTTGKKESRIISDANDYAKETLDNSRYPLELLLSIITVSVETMKIVKSLPKLDI